MGPTRRHRCGRRSTSWRCSPWCKAGSTQGPRGLGLSESQVELLCAPLGRRVRAIVNYEGFVLAREIEDAWAQSVARIVERWYEGVTRYTTSAFLRAKLGEALARRKVAAHVFETAEEAREALRSGGGDSAR